MKLSPLTAMTTLCAAAADEAGFRDEVKPLILKNNAVRLLDPKR